MRRLASIGVGLVIVGVAATLLLGSSYGGGGDPYTVRAIFDDAAFAVPGEDVRIAGAPVGTIGSLSVCVPRQNRPCAPGTALKAAVTFTINRAGFTPFHTNASCAIRPQSLIGEKFMDCNPGTASAPPLPQIHYGEGAGQFYLPVTHTSSPVDTDIVQDIYRQPVRQQFALIINELGTGLAARGSDLNAVIHRANPALGYTDQVLKILAAQNRQLAQLAKDSDTVLTPLAQDKEAIRQWVIQSNTTSVASAARARDIAASFHLLPPFLRQLRPLMADLAAFADTATPVLNSLSQAAPALATQYQELVPFADVARKSLISLGAAAQQQQPELLATIPLANQLLHLGQAGVPSFTALDRLTSSFNDTGGIESLMGVLFNATGATNGFDADGHYIRTEALVGGCTGYAKTPVPGCSANFTHTGAAGDPGAGPAAVTSRAGAGGSGDAGATRKVLAAVGATQAAAVESSRTVTLGHLLGYLIGTGP
ncbi:MAG: MCE family protein [Solirubrobacterales bacterium]|nr:MCE family protein [Solirubrobacterales bacterium]